MLAFGVILTLFFAPMRHDQRYVRNFNGLAYEITAMVFVGMLNSLAFYPPERNLFYRYSIILSTSLPISIRELTPYHSDFKNLYREYADGASSIETFFLSYLTLEVPFEIISSLLAALLVHQAVGGMNQTGESFFVLTYVIFMYLNAGESLGILFCSFVYVVGFSARYSIDY